MNEQQLIDAINKLLAQAKRREDEVADNLATKPDNLFLLGRYDGMQRSLHALAEELGILHKINRRW